VYHEAAPDAADETSTASFPWPRGAILRRMRAHVVVMLLASLAAVLVASCGLINDCPHAGQRGPCAGPHAKMTCTGGEGSYHFAEEACGAKEKCVETRGQGACVDAHYDAACADRTACGTLDCLDGRCVHATESSSTWCGSPTRMTKPAAVGTSFRSTFEGNLPPPPAIYAASLVPSSCGQPKGGIVLLSAEPPDDTSLEFSLSLRAKTPRTAIYLRPCGWYPGITSIECATEQPVTLKTSRAFVFMVASLDANPSAIPFVVEATWAPPATR
jgi:hypothetical protein